MLAVRKKATILLAVLTSCIFGATLYELAGLSINMPILSHSMLIPAMSLYLLWTDRKAIFSRVDYVPGIGIGLMAISLGVLVFQKWQFSNLGQIDALSVTVGSLVIWIWGGFLWLCGRHAFRKALFPLLFLAYMIPIPALVLDPVVRFLQLGTTYAVIGILKLLTIPIYYEGVLISLPGVTVEIAKECSGIRSALALLIMTTVAGYMFLRSNWRRWCLVIFVVPVTILKNGMRVTTLALLGAYVDMSYLTDSALHSWGGKPFLLIAMMMMFPILWALRKSEKKNTHKEQKNKQSLSYRSI